MPLVHFRLEAVKASIDLVLPVIGSKDIGWFFDPDACARIPDAVGVWDRNSVSGSVLWDGQELFIHWSDEDETSTLMSLGLPLHLGTVLRFFSKSYPERDFTIVKVD